MTAPQHEGHHPHLPFWRKYIFSIDHKIIGVQYGITALLFLFFGFSLMMVMRWSIAYQGKPLPDWVAAIVNFPPTLTNHFFGTALTMNAPGGILVPEFYHPLGAMHGTIMVFLGVVPL